MQSVTTRPAQLQVRQFGLSEFRNTNCFPHENDVCEPNRAERQSLLKAFSQVLSLCHFLLDAHGEDAVSYVYSSN